MRLNVYSFAVDGLLIDTGAESLFEQFKSFFAEIDYLYDMRNQVHHLAQQGLSVKQINNLVKTTQSSNFQVANGTPSI